jgi:transposase
MRLFPRRRRRERGGCGGYIKPSYSPELNPAERVFAAVWRWVEGRRYERTEAKKAAGEGVLRGLEAEKRVSSLVGWRYIRQALHALPSGIKKLCL